MANSKITLTFNAPMEHEDTMYITDSNGVPIILDWASGASDIPPSGNIDDDVINTYYNIQLLYNVTNRYTVQYDLGIDEIIITDNIGNTEFSVLINGTNGRITTVVDNQPIITPIQVTNLSIEENTSNKCNTFAITVTTNVQADNVSSPVNQVVTTNPFTLNDIPRDSVNRVELIVNEGVYFSTNLFFVPFLETAMFQLDVEKQPSSSSLNITWIGLYEPVFNLEYSLNNINFYNSTSFSGLDEGNHTLYIKDGIGCQIQIPFVVDEFTPNVFVRKPYFSISKHNSLIYVKREVIDDCNIFSNVNNTMSYEENTQVNYRDFKQPFQICDGLRVEQLKTIYENVNVDLIDCDGIKVNLPLTQKSNNLEATDVRDVKISAIEYLGSQFVGVSYVSGKTYDPITLLENGSYYLGTSAPLFMNKDDFIHIASAGWFKVKDKIYKDGLQYLVLDVLQSNFPISVTGQTLKGTSVYNIQPYEVYEFDFDFGTLNGDYYLNVKATDSEFEDIEYSTEWFNVKENQRNTYVLQYYNSVNNDTNYSTGIRYKIRLPYAETETDIGKSEHDIIETDTNAFLAEAKFTNTSELEIMPSPMCFKKKIQTILINDRLFLQGVSKLASKEIEQERIGSSNLYKITLGFIDADNVYSNIASDGIVTQGGQVLGTDNFTQQALGVKQQ